MKLALFIFAVLISNSGTMSALAEVPELAVYVTNANENVYVALYGDVAIELAGCEKIDDGRALLQLPPESQALETTLGSLETNFGFGSHPRIPCGKNTQFDLDWSATTPIWPDLNESGNYYFPAPNDAALFYAVPRSCTGIKTALATRERLQLPGVKQDMNAPEGLDSPVVLGCGNAPFPPEGSHKVSRTEVQWSLHKFETFLSEESIGDTIYVARYQSPAEGVRPAYLPIWRVNGQASSDIVLSGNSLAEETEAALKSLFGIPATASVTLLGGEAVAAVRSAVYVDLCLSNCESYAYRHAAFLNPGIDFSLTELGDTAVLQRLNRLGSEQLVWGIKDMQETVFTACDSVSTALGLHSSSENINWMTSVDAGLRAASQTGSEFVCHARAADICLRRVTDGMPLSQAMFDASDDCPVAHHLRIELPGSVQMPAPLLLSGTNFHTIELVPSPGVTKSVVTGTPGRLSAESTSCILSSTEGLILADNLSRLEIRNVVLRRADGDSSGDVVAVKVQNGALILENVVLGGDTEGTMPVGRGVTLCHGDLYAAESTIDSLSLGIQGVSARILLSGTATNPTLVTQSRYGLLLSGKQHCAPGSGEDCGENSPGHARCRSGCDEN